MRQCTIYALVDPRDNRVRYVGSTAMRPQNRFAHHVWQARSPLGEKLGGASKRAWIMSLLDLGLVPELLILEECDPAERKIAERKWTLRYRSEGLLNVFGASIPDMGPMPDQAAEMLLAGHTTKAVAKAMDVSVGTVSHWRNGKFGHEGLDAWLKRKQAGQSIPSAV